MNKPLAIVRFRAASAVLAALCVCVLLAPSCRRHKPASLVERGPAAMAAPELHFVRAWGTDTSSGGNLSGPAALVLLDDGSLLALDRFNRRIQHYGPDGRYLGAWGAAPGGRPFPFSVLVDMDRDAATGDIVVAVNHRMIQDTANRTCGGMFYADTLLTFSQDGAFKGDPALVDELAQSAASTPDYLRRLNDDFWNRNEEMFCLSFYDRIAVNTAALKGAVTVINSAPYILTPDGNRRALDFPHADGAPETFCEVSSDADGWLNLMGCLLRLEVYRTRFEDAAGNRLYLDEFLRPSSKRKISTTVETRHNLFHTLPGGGYAVYDVKGEKILVFDAKGQARDPIKIATRIYFAKDFLPDGQGGFLVADYVADSVVRLKADGRFGGRLGTNRAAPGQFAGHSFALFRGNPDSGDRMRPAGIVGVAATPDGRVFASDAHNRRVQVFDARGRFLDAIYLCGAEKSCFPADLAAANNAIYVTLYGQHAVVKLNPGTGQELARWRVPKPDPLGECSLCGLGADPRGNIFVSDGLHVYKLDPDLKPDTAWNRDALSVPRLQYPVDLAFDARGRLFLAGTSVPPLLAVGHTTSAVCRFTEDLEFDQCFEWHDQLYQPRSVAVTGNTLLVSSSAEDTVVQADLDGAIIQIWGGPGRDNGMFQNPLGITADTHGNVFIADNGNERVQQFRMTPPRNTAGKSPKRN